MAGNADQLVVDLAQITQSGSGTTATFTQNSVVAPGSGDTFSYTPPGTNTTSAAVYAGPPSGPSYAAAQTVTATAGSPAAPAVASTSNPLGVGTGNPVIVYVAAGAGTANVYYDENTTCGTAGTTAFGDYSWSTGPTPARACTSTPEALATPTPFVTLTIAGMVATSGGTVTYTPPVAGNTGATSTEAAGTSNYEVAQTSSVNPGTQSGS